MKQFLLIFLGGGAGSVLRFIVTKALNPSSGIPYGTFSVNIIGSLLLGFLLGIGIKENILSSNTTLLLATGFCGGFTTFSAFAFENNALLRSGDYINLALYALGSIIAGVLAVAIGLALSRMV